MISTQEILFGETSQSLVIDHELLDLGRPSSITGVSVWPYYADDTSTAEDATTGSPAVATNPNTTLSAGASEANPRALSVSSATGFTIGRRYLLTEDSTGVSEVFELAGLNGTSLTSRHPLINDYTSGATVVTCRCTQALSDTWVADVNNILPPGPNPGWRARWELVIGGVTHIVDQGFDLLRYSSRTGVTGLDVDNVYPGWIDRLPPDYRVDQGRALIRRAEQAVKFELYGDAQADQSLRTPEHRARLAIVRANLEAVRDNVFRGAASDAALSLAERDWRQIYDQTIRAPVANVDVNGGGGAAAIRPVALVVR